ncbi:alanine racemase [Bacillus salitolerans]|uniref:Alanine racemase n=1 Tax=Bacillus salitolerans TaxID=1437434 RepID=A0ABW4LRG7_9BACI
MAPFYRDTWVEVQLDHIYENVKSMREYLPVETHIMAVVKANAYGHGAFQVAKTALQAGASFLAVAFLDEALSLRKKGINVRILVLGAIRHEDAILAAEHDITVTVYQKEWLLRALKNHSFRKKLRIHLKVDTGMGRLGIKEFTELNEIIELIQHEENIDIDGVYTHFATADEVNTDYFDRQYGTFLEALAILNAHQVDIPHIHCGNSAAGLRFPTKVFNVVRMGIAMYGLSPSEEINGLLPFTLKEAFSLHSRLIHVKKLQPGDKVSYGATYTAEEEEWIGTIPVGYADGWIRRLKNREVIVEGQRVPIIGRICMDQFMVKLPGPMELGSKVTLIGSQGNEVIPIDEIARELETINYEIPCMISFRVPRIYIQSDQIVEVENHLN